MSEMHEFIVDTTNKILKKYATKETIEASEKGLWSTQLWDVLVQSGLVTVGVDEELGGTGGDAIDAFAILRLAGKYAAPVPILETVISGWLLKDYKIETTSEPISIVLDDENDLNSSEFILKKVPWGRHVKRVVYIGKINGTYKLTILPTVNTEVKQNHNMAGEPLDDLYFTDINLRNLPQFEVNQSEIYNRVMTLGALGKSAMMAGAMEQVLEMCIFYAGERHQFGRPLGKFPSIQYHLSAMTAETASVLAALNHAVVAFDNGLINEELPLAKMKISEAAGKVAGISHQLHGAIGMTYEHQLHQFTRRLWTWREEYGSEVYWAKKLANSYIDSNSVNLWNFITKEKVGNIYV